MKVTATKTDILFVNFNWLITLAIMTIGLAIFAIVFPLFATLDLTLFFGAIFILTGIIQIIYALQSWYIGRVLWLLILGCSYLMTGIFVAMYPLSGVFTIFTLVLGITIFVQGIIQVSLSLQIRPTVSNWGWMLVSGIIGIIFGIYIWSSSLLSAAWLIGNLIGINLLVDGVWMLALPDRKPSILRS
jgi:uncharacterized membrane protein HdeD (DUF308 family)